MKFFIITLALWGILFPQSSFCAHEPLFEYLAKYTLLPYALLGHKPIALHEDADHPHAWQKNPRWMLSGWRKLPQWWVHPQWWDAFYADRGQIDSSNFCLKQDKYECVILINKKNCLKVITDHIALFQEICGCKTADALLKELCDADDIYSCMKDSQVLLGLLLDFGKENAQMFEDVFDNFCLEPADFGGFNPETYWDDDLLPYRLPDFRALNSAETENLRQIYLQDQKKIAKIFSERNAKEVFFECLELTE